MNLIRCNHCGRPFYDSEKACPFCGHASTLSVNNRVTKAISDPKSHKLMEDFFAGNLQHPDIRTVDAVPVTKTVEPQVKASPVADAQPASEPEPTAEPKPINEPEPVAATQPVAEPEAVQPSEAVLDRADSIAAITADAPLNKEEAHDEQPDELETTLPRKKRHGWIWIIILVIILALAAAVYLKWDLVYSKISSIIN